MFYLTGPLTLLAIDTGSGFKQLSTYQSEKGRFSGKKRGLPGYRPGVDVVMVYARPYLKLPPDFRPIQLHPTENKTFWLPLHNIPQDRDAVQSLFRFHPELIQFRHFIVSGIQPGNVTFQLLPGAKWRNSRGTLY